MRNYAVDFEDAQSIQSLIKPLETLGIIGFFFIRRYPDGTFIDLTSDPIWAEFFFKKFYNLEYDPNAIVNHLLPSLGVGLSALNPQNEIWRDGKEYFGVGNGIILTRQFEHYHESYFFYAHKENHAINEIYLNNLDLLNRFIDYFKQKANDFIIKGDVNKFQTPEKYFVQPDVHVRTQDNLTIKQLMHTFEEEGVIINPMQSLSKKEIMCLFYLVQGKSAAEIANILCRSKRTVEQHIENAKRKLNCQKISQMAYLLGKLNIEDFI